MIDDFAKPLPRRKSVGVMVGNVQVGGDAPIVVQSMTNTDTADAAATSGRELGRDTALALDAGGRALLLTWDRGRGQLLARGTRDAVTGATLAEALSTTPTSEWVLAQAPDLGAGSGPQPAVATRGVDGALVHVVWRDVDADPANTRLVHAALDLASGSALSL